MSAAFQLEGYKIEKLIYENNPLFEGDELQLIVTPTIEHHEDDDSRFRYTVDMTVTCTANIHIVIYGYFTSTGVYKDDEVDNALLYVGLATLMPYIRSILSTVTALDMGKQLILPLFNINELLSSENNVNGSAEEIR